MEHGNSLCISFSGITVRFRFPGAVPPSKELAPLVCEDPEAVDETYEICLIKTPLSLPGDPVYSYQDIQIYPTEQGWLRIYTSLIARDGCQVACLLRPDGNNKLFYPASMWDFFSQEFHCLHLLGGEALLIKYNAFLLHSSVVRINGKMVLFSGPSGAGKSTQAELWSQYLGAEIINGDRCVVMEKDGGFFGGGSPWCGTSGIRRKEIAPIAGIFLVHHAAENQVRKLGIEAFTPLFSQITVNCWDRPMMEKLSSLFIGMLDAVPVYRLDCRPDEEAVRLVYDTLFGKEQTPCTPREPRIFGSF